MHSVIFHALFRLRLGESSMSGMPKLSERWTWPLEAPPLAPGAAMVLAGRELGGDVAGGDSCAGSCDTGRREPGGGGDVAVGPLCPSALSSGSFSCTAPIFANELPLSGRCSSCVSLDDVGTYVLIVVDALTRRAGVGL